MTHWQRMFVEHYLVLPLGAVVALLWAAAFPVRYFQVAQSLAFWVNDVGMAIVLGYVAQEVIEAAMPGGTLHPWGRAVVPVIAAIGGTLGATAMYAAYIHAGDEEVLAQGWPVVCAVDILFSLAIARALFGRGAASTFLLLLAIASDVVGLAVISTRYPVARTHLWGGTLIVPAVLVCVALRQHHQHSVLPYVLLAGPLSWLACYAAGVHPSLALLPVVPFVPHTARDLTAVGHDDPGHETASHFEHVFEWPVQAIAFLFGVVNAGVLLRGYGTGTWAVLAASLAGRPAGILAAVGLAVAAGLHVPRDIGARDVIAIAFAASPSLAFGLFFATAVFPIGPLLIQTKMGAIATAIGVLPALAAARLLRVGRFA